MAYTLSITLTDDQKASLDAMRPDIIEFGTNTPKYSTTAAMCGGLFVELILAQALRTHPGTGTAAATAIADEAAATTAKNNALKPTLTVTLT